MPRLPRYVIPGQPQHVIQRGNNRSVIFAADYRFYLEKLREAAKRWQCDVHAYVLMTNHVHLLLTPKAEEYRQAHAVSRALLCPVLQPHLRPHRHPLGRALPRHCDGQ